MGGGRDDADHQLGVYMAAVLVETNVSLPITLSSQFLKYRGTSLIRKRRPLGPYNSPMPRALWWF